MPGHNTPCPAVTIPLPPLLQVPNRPVDSSLAAEKVQQLGTAIADSLTTSVDTPGTSKGRDSTGTRDSDMTEARLAAEDVAEAVKKMPQAAGGGRGRGGAHSTAAVEVLIAL